MAKTVTEVEDGIADNIESANMSTEKSLADTLEGKGYRKRGNMFTRKAIIDMTLLGGIEEERHEIEAYHHFIAPEFETGVDLSRESLSSMGYEEIELKVQKAVTNLRRYSDLIFGSKTSKETANWKGFDEEFSSYVKNAEKSFNSSRQASKYKDTKGLFYMHLGYAPVMKDKEPEKVKTAGYGEYGRIYELYFRNEARLGRGIASLDQPWYSQKLWDDDRDNDGESDGLFGAPSVRSIGNIAMTIVAGTGPLAFAVNMIDDAAFTAMDIGSGITDWDDGMMSLGKQTATGAVTQGIGSKYDKFKSDSFLATTGAAGIKTASTNLATTAINSFDLNSGGLYFNTNSFENNWKSDLYGKGAVSGYISSMGTAGLNSTLTGFYGNDLAYGKALSSSIAGSAASIYEYNALGSTTLNVLNTTDILSFLGADNLIDDYGGVGLLEMGVGDGGSLFNFGTEGQNVNASQIASAYQGINTYYQNARISLSQKENIRDARVGMRALYSRGGTDEEAMKLYTNLLSGKDNIEIDNSIKTEAETVKNTETGGRTILLNSNIGKDKMSGLHLGIVLGHEAYRDGYKVGCIDKNGNIETLESNTRETKAGSINRMEMALAIEKDYKGFIKEGTRLSDEVKLYEAAKKIGNLKLFTDYIESSYNHEKDYYFPEISNNGMYQNINNKRLKNETLLNGMTEVEVNEYNEKLLEASVDAYAVDVYGNMDISESMKNELKKDILENKGRAKKYLYNPIEHESIASDGCKLFDAVYTVNSLTGKEIDIVDANKKLKDAGIYTNNNLLTTENYKDALNILADGLYEFEHVFSKEGVTYKDLYKYATSKDQYVAHLRIKKENRTEDYHSEAFAGLKNSHLVYIDNGRLSYTADTVKTANSWAGNSYTGKTNRTLDEIYRWDIFKATPTAKYYHEFEMLYKLAGLR